MVRAIVFVFTLVFIKNIQTQVPKSTITTESPVIPVTGNGSNTETTITKPPVIPVTHPDIGSGSNTETTSTEPPVIPVTKPNIGNGSNTETTSTEPTVIPVTKPNTGNGGNTKNSVTEPPVIPVTNPNKIIDRNIKTSRSKRLPRPPFCGHHNVTNNRIVHGTPAKLGEFPWAVILGYRNKENATKPDWLCGGTLISDLNILTAAHCVYNRYDLYIVRLGELDLASDEDGASPEDIHIVNVNIHESYEPATFRNDIAILTLEHTPTTKLVAPVCLPLDKKLRSNDYEGTNGFIIGWGKLFYNATESTNILQKAQVEVLENDQCKKNYENFPTVIDEGVMCAGMGVKDACKGDSGGPLMFQKADHSVNRYFQIGIVSYGFKCAVPGFPGVYTRVTHFIDWITRNVN